MGGKLSPVEFSALLYSRSERLSFLKTIDAANQTSYACLHINILSHWAYAFRPYSIVWAVSLSSNTACPVLTDCSN